MTYVLWLVRACSENLGMKWLEIHAVKGFVHSKHFYPLSPVVTALTRETQDKKDV